MDKNTQWALVTAAIGGAAYFAIRNKRAPITEEEAEFLRPAPVSRLERDPFPLSPEYIVPNPMKDEGYVTEAIPVYGSPYGANRNPGTPQTYAFPYAANSDLPQLGELITPTSTAPKPPKPAPVLTNRIPDMKLGTANIRNFPDMAKPKVRADAKKMGQVCTIWGGQEIEPGEDYSVVLDGLGNNWRGLFGDRTTPIFFRSDKWKPEDLHQIFLPRGNLPLTSKSASITSAYFKSVDRPDVGIAVVNCHLITHGPAQKDRRTRRELWGQEYRKFQAVVNYHLQKGRSVAFVGDFNSTIVAPPVRGARWVMNGGIDKIGFVNSPRGVILRPRGGGEIHALNSDHNGRTISLQVVKRKSA